MRGYHDFIVHIPEKYAPTFKTESGFEVHADRRYSLKMVANTVVEVLETPFGYGGPVSRGDRVFIDPSVLMQQLFTKGGEAANIHEIDRKNGLYKVDPKMLLAHETVEGWIGLNGNTFVKRLPMPKLQSDHLEVVDFQKTGINEDVARRGEVIVPPHGEDHEIVWFRNLYSVDIWMDGMELVWIREKDLLAEEIAA